MYSALVMIFFFLKLSKDRHLHVQITVKYSSTIKSFTVKNNFGSQTHVVGIHKIPCKGYTLVCIDETGRNLETPLKEYKAAVRSCKTKNAVFNHVSTIDRSSDWDSNNILF